MNILYLIGNGFDVNLGMKTKYRHFYEYYIKLPGSNDSSVIKEFKNELEANLENWSDLEFALGDYLKKLDAGQAVELHRNLVSHLSEYIKTEEAKYPFDKQQTTAFASPDCNTATRLDHDAKCTQWIHNAHLICAFGLSFGDTDKKWWKAVGDKIKSDCKMIIFEFNPDKKFNLNEHVDQLEEEELIKERFLAKTDVKKDLWDMVKRNIYVAYNTDMFKMDIGKQVPDSTR